jgi:hypothetical protein
VYDISKVGYTMIFEGAATHIDFREMMVVTEAKKTKRTI